MPFLAQFKIRCRPSKLELVRSLLKDRGIYIRGYHEKRCKKRITLRFIPSFLGEVQSFESIERTRVALWESRIRFTEKLVLAIVQGEEIRMKLEERLNIYISYTCPHPDPSRPGFQVFEVEDPILAEGILSDACRCR
jgi:hypothetical protein